MPIDPWSVFTATFGSVPKPGAAFITLIDIAIYTVPAPAVEGPEAFLRIMRVHANTAEQLIMHLPLLWIAAFAMDDAFAASFGAVWALGRVLYARGYYRKPKRRVKGFVIAMIVNAILFAGALAGTIASF
jgi:glutathione S-transferase